MSVKRNVPGKNILIRCDANRIVGMGHFARCCNLALALQAKGYKSYFLMRDPSKIALEQLRKLSIRFFLLSVDEDNEDGILLQICSGLDARLVVFDVMHSCYQNSPSRLLRQIDILRPEKAKVLFIDDMDQYCLSLKAQINVDMLLIPYYGAEHLNLDEYSNRGVQIMCGIKYFPLASGLLSLDRGKTFLKSMSNINLIVSLGGTQNSIKDTALESELSMLCSYHSNLSIRVVESEMRVSDHPSVSVIPFSQNFYEQLRWADVALIGSGLSRYETSYAGVPAVVLLSSEGHKSMVEKFEHAQSIIYGGSLDNPKLAVQHLSHIISDPAILTKMSNNGKRLVDGHGIKRIINSIENMIA